MFDFLKPRNPAASKSTTSSFKNPSSKRNGKQLSAPSTTLTEPLTGATPSTVTTPTTATAIPSSSTRGATTTRISTRKGSVRHSNTQFNNLISGMRSQIKYHILIATIVILWYKCFFHTRYCLILYRKLCPKVVRLTSSWKFISWRLILDQKSNVDKSGILASSNFNHWRGCTVNCVQVIKLMCANLINRFSQPWPRNKCTVLLSRGI